MAAADNGCRLLESNGSLFAGKLVHAVERGAAERTKEMDKRLVDGMDDSRIGIQGSIGTVGDKDTDKDASDDAKDADGVEDGEPIAGTGLGRRADAINGAKELKEGGSQGVKLVFEIEASEKLG